MSTSLQIKSELSLAPLSQSEALDIIRYGSEVSEEIKETSNKVLSLTNSKENLETRSLVANLQRVMTKINPDELKQFSEEEKGFKKFLAKILKTKDQLMAKYTNVGEELSGMYATVKKKSVILEQNNAMLNEFQASSMESLEKLREYIAHAEAELSVMESELDMNDMASKELIIILKQKIGDLRGMEMVIDQTVHNINVTKKTNYLVYKKMFSCYDTILPTIQNQIALNQTSQQHIEMINELKTMDELKNQLIVSTARDVAQSGIDAMNLLDAGESTFEAVKQAQELFNEGVKQIEALESQKMESLDKVLLEYKSRKEREV